MPVTMMDMRIALAVALPAFALFGCISTQPIAPMPPATCTYENAQATALEFLTSDETYAFDAIESTLEFVESMPVQGLPGAWTFTYLFDSSHGGYGDREGQIVTEAITPHRASIVVADCEVRSAVLDGEWDMLEEKQIEMPPPPCSGTEPGCAVLDFCGGIAGIQCPAGYECVLDGDYPDAGGTCVPAGG